MKVDVAKIRISLAFVLICQWVCARVPEKDSYVSVLTNQACRLSKESLFELEKEPKAKFNQKSLLEQQKVFRAQSSRQQGHGHKFEDFSWHINQGLYKGLFPPLYTQGQHIALSTSHQPQINCYYHNRGSDKIIFIAPGFNNQHSVFLPFLGMFEDFDVVFIDYRGVYPFSQEHFGKHWLVFDPGIFTLGENEDEDIALAVDYFTKKIGKKYSKVVGMGMCFGGAMMVKAQAKNPSLFSHLILDSLWTDSDSLLVSFLKDPALFLRPQKNEGGVLALLSHIPGVKQSLKFMCERFVFKRRIPTIDACSFLQKISIPTLFFYGTRDLLVPQHVFEQVFYSSASAKKLAVMTNCKHLLNFLQQRFLYQGVANAFIEDASTLIRKLESSAQRS